MTLRPATLLCLSLAVSFVAGCGGQSMNLKLWPFGGSAPAEQPRGPQTTPTQPTAIQTTGPFQCATGKGFTLRRLDDGAALWLVLPEREVRLERLEADGSRYGKGGLALDIGAEALRLSDGGTVTYDDCKPAATAPK